MTWSILARDPDTGTFAIAVATKFFAVGALVPHARAGVGAVATQALINPFYGLDGLNLLQDGLPATDVIAKLVASDDGRDQRQVHAIDAQGRTAAHTGQSCVDWCGAGAERDLSVAGNMLANANVVEATAARQELAQDDGCPALREDLGGHGDRAELTIASHGQDARGRGAGRQVHF